MPDGTKRTNDDGGGELNTKLKEVITNRFQLDVLMRLSSFSCS